MAMPSTFIKRLGPMLYPDHARSRRILQKRVRRLLEIEGAPEDSKLRHEVLPFLSSLGSVALIGGAIRDVARGGKKAFSSDFDFVIYGSDRARFVAEMDALGAVRNRFGGYALNRFSVKVDVWHIEDTWARTAGLASVTQPSDLLNCTFFDWDSIVYDVSFGHLIAPPDYFQRLLLNVMDIRLEENPNPIGSLVRALRRAALWHVHFGPRLTRFCHALLEKTDWHELVALDARAFSKPVLQYLDSDTLRFRLSLVTRTSMGDATLPVPEAQLCLPLSSETTSLSPIG
jgi:hypothetical protein